jgi:thioredoxin reductase (NADPH)
VSAAAANRHQQLVVIGSGPAGLTAALYASRANLTPLLIEGVEAGGQLMLTTLVENYPGFRSGVMGPDLMAEMRAQAEHFGAEILQGDVTSVDLSNRPFLINLGKTQYSADALIIATGASAKWLDLGVDKQLSGRGVSTCATCDGFFFKGLPVAVIGGGDTAMEEAIYLSKLATQVTVIHRRDSLRASKVMQDKAMSTPNISFLWNKEVVDIKDIDQGKVTSLVLRDVKTGERSERPVDGVFIGIGHVPNTALFRGQLAMHDNGYLKTHDGSRTSVKGVFAAGDVQDHVYRQAVTAAGSGCMAAIDAERFLSGTLHERHPESVNPTPA